MLWPSSEAQGALQASYFNLLGLRLAQTLEATMAFLDSGVDGLPRQQELAKLLRRSKATPELVKKLEQIPNPEPCLAVEMCQVFRRERRFDEGKRLLQELNPLIPCDDQSRRLYVHVQSELALCEWELNNLKGYTMFKDVVRCSMELLGRTDEYTIQLRVTFAENLEWSSHYSGALDVLVALKADSKDLLHPWSELVMQMEKRLRDNIVKKRRRDRPMPVEQTLIEDNKENIPQSEPHSLSKKRKLT